MLPYARYIMPYISKDMHGKRLKAYRRRVRLEVLAAYSVGDTPRCYCCGEECITFLTLDHINDDGARIRKKRPPGYSYCTYLKVNNFPPGIRTACFNCNTGRYINGGECPHTSPPSDDWCASISRDKNDEFTNEDISSTYRLHRRRMRDGLCIACGDTATHPRFCDECWVKETKRQRMKKKRKKEKEAGIPVKSRR